MDLCLVFARRTGAAWSMAWRARFTDCESGYASAISGSRTTAIVSRGKSCAYRPRFPPEKSYSVFISASLTDGSLIFFIVFSFRACCFSGTDDTNFALSIRMCNDNQQPLSRQPDGYMPLPNDTESGEYNAKAQGHKGAKKEGNLTQRRKGTKAQRKRGI